MSGLDKMTQQILAEAQAEADKMEKDAKAEAESLLSQAKSESESFRKAAQGSLEQELHSLRARAASSRDLTRRRAVLETKQEIIAEIIDKTCSRLRNADTSEYFQVLVKMFARFAHGEDGQMFLGKKDLERIPADFKAKIEGIAVEKGGSIQIQAVPGNIPDGFLLVYGGIEENCTFEALFAAERNRLQDAVNKMLWRECNG